MASGSDWTSLSNDDQLADQWAFIKPILDEVAALLNLKVVRTGTTPPDDIVKGLILGDETNDELIRIRAHDSNGSFLIDKNDNPGGAASWTTVATFDTSGNLTITGSLTAGGLSASHASTHLPNGADALDTSGTYSEVTQAASVEGTANALARQDHSHRGVHSVKKTGEADIYGDVELDEGSNITLTQVGQKITIAAAGTTASRSFYKKTGSDQSGVSGDTDVTELTALSIPGTPDGVKKYRVSAVVSVVRGGSAGDCTLRLWVGTNGDTGDGTPVFETAGANQANQPVSLAIAEFEIQPGGSDMIGLSVQSSSAIDIKGGGQSYLSVTEVLT